LELPTVLADIKKGRLHFLSLNEFFAAIDAASVPKEFNDNLQHQKPI